MTYFDDGKVKTSVCYTHYGHEVELRHCRLTKKQKKVIALKLKDGVAKTKILDSIRDNFEGPFQRIPLLQNKDMRNIPISFGLDDTRRREDDQTSVRSWIHDWSLREDTPFLYYKLEGKYFSMLSHVFKFYTLTNFGVVRHGPFLEDPALTHSLTSAYDFSWYI